MRSSLGLQKKKKQDIFKQKKLIGTGSFGYVYKCLNRLDGKTYAVKTIEISSQTNTENISKECSAMIAAKSDFTVELLDHFEDEQMSSYIIVMPYYRKGSLSAYIDLQWPKVNILCLLYQISQAFLANYRQRKQNEEIGCWHLDLKPDNILIKTEGQYLIADYGCAKIVNDLNKSRLLEISQGRGGGTRQYASPELIVQYQVGRFSDIWSVGIILYKILYKKNPFQLMGYPSNSVYEFMSKFQKGMVQIIFPPKPGYEQIIQICKLCLQRQKRLQWQQLNQLIYQCLGLPLKTDIVVNIQKLICFAQNVSKILMGLVFYLQKNQKHLQKLSLKMDSQKTISSCKTYVSLLYKEIELSIESTPYEKSSQRAFSSTFYLFPQIHQNYTMQQKQRLVHLRSVAHSFCQKQYNKFMEVPFINIKIGFESEIRDFVNAMRMMNVEKEKLSFHPFYQWDKIQQICAFILRTGNKMVGLEYSNRDVIEEFAEKIVNQ